ncbi:MAG: hypothetical protein ABI758_01590 [Candidatus Woesebacteria bacterium]
MRRLFLFLIPTLFFCAAFVQSTQKVAAGYTCCDKTGTIPPQDYGLHCDACGSKETKNAGDSCGTNANCSPCGGGRPYSNACGGSGGGQTNTCQFYEAGPFVFPSDTKGHVVGFPLGASGLPQLVSYTLISTTAVAPTNFRMYPPYSPTRVAPGYYYTSVIPLKTTIPIEPGDYIVRAKGIYNCPNGDCARGTVKCSRDYKIIITPPGTPASPTPNPSPTPSPSPTPAPKVSISSTIETDPSLTGGQPPQPIGFTDTYCNSPSSGAKVSNGSIGATDLSGKSYLGTINSAGTYTISNLPTAAGEYCVKYTPSNSNIVCTCPSGCEYCGKSAPTTQNLKFYISPIGSAWYQTVGGEVAAQSRSGLSFSDKVATPCVEPFCSPFLSVPIGTDTRTLGSLITNRNSSVDLGAGEVAKFPNTRSVRLPTSLVCSENYDYFYRLYSLGLSPSSTDFLNPLDARKPTTAPNDGKSAFYYEGNTPLTISTPWTVGSTESIVVFVRGNLKIANTVTVAPNGFLAFIVSGTIDIDPSVGTSDHASTKDGQVQGIYITNGSIRVLGVGSGGTEKKFIGEGTFAACNGIKIDRDFNRGGAGLDNNKYAASLFIYRPDFMTSTPDRMKTSKFNWTEVAP